MAIFLSNRLQKRCATDIIAVVADDDCRFSARGLEVDRYDDGAEVDMDDNVIKFKPKRQPKSPRKLSRWQRKIVIVVFICGVFGVIYLKNWITGQG